MARFNIEQIIAAQDVVDPLFLNTPQYQSETLGAEFGCDVLLKIETLNPIRSFKGRGADLLVQSASDKRLICASAGNFGQAMAYACRKKSIKLTVFASQAANTFKVERMKAFGAEVIQQGRDFDESKSLARSLAARQGVRFVEDSLDVETAIGAGTMAVELLDSATPDMIVVPLGNGALINGVGTVAKGYKRGTAIVGVQSEGAPAMVESWRQRKVVTHETMSTIADGIGVRIPVAEALSDMNGLVDDAMLVREETILKAMKLIHFHAGIAVEPSAAVGVAAMMEHPDAFRDKRVAVIITGSNLTRDQMEMWY